MKQTVTTSERGYTVAISKAAIGGKPHYGLNVSVSGESKAKVVREAKMLFDEVQRYALEAHAQFYPEAEKPEGKSEKEEE